ncbi:hypothetical protein M218_04145 [Burkholderia pseudomallei MSHR338]|nr:hypothetical protein M218_04145 [Burkholderia pseudomallei MSHR338]
MAVNFGVDERSVFARRGTSRGGRTLCPFIARFA